MICCRNSEENFKLQSLMYLKLRNVVYLLFRNQLKTFNYKFFNSSGYNSRGVQVSFLKAPDNLLSGSTALQLFQVPTVLPRTNRYNLIPNGSSCL